MFIALVVVSLFSASAFASEWQWAVPYKEGRAYLWVPPSCKQVRAVVLANHNMIEQGILEHPTFRATLSELGMAEIWVVPGMDIKFDFNAGADKEFESITGALAEVSGYDEVRTAPVVTLGHSANATWGWNFAAWNPARTLAVLSIHGDAPQTTLTGYGRPNVDWGGRNIDGVPGLMVMGEYEWWEDRLTPALNFRALHPATPLALLADAGHGHFDYSEQLVQFLALFVRKAAKARLPKHGGEPLRKVDPRKGWLVDRWRKDALPTTPSAPASHYRGNPKEAFWAFDKEMAEATEGYYAAARGKKPQLLSVTDGQTSIEKGVGEPVTPRFIPQADGISFQLKTNWVDFVPSDNSKATLWTGQSAGAYIGHPVGGGPIQLSKIVGPAIKTGPDTFRVALDSLSLTVTRGKYDLWVWAHHPGDREYKSMVQQAKITLTPNTVGQEQHLVFPTLPNVKAGTPSLVLGATSDAKMPVSYTVIAGPAEVEGNTLRLTRIPPRAKFPVKVTVAAWQWGKSAEPAVKTAVPVEQSFFVTH